MSGVVDHSTMGLALGTELPISQAANFGLRKAMYQASLSTLPYATKFILASGDKKEGNAVYLMEYPIKNGGTNTTRYEFKKTGKNYFLNASGNPTCMAVGANDIPILIKGFEYGDYNTPTITFKYLNRLMYAALDTILETMGFNWDKYPEDKARLKSGDISIHAYQIAWYSGDLGMDRDTVLRYLRLVYGGQDATLENVGNVMRYLGINARSWDNDEGNLTLSVMSGDKNKYFTLTLYAKDRHPDYMGMAETQKRVSHLIRWDCTLTNSFLQNNRIKKIKELEDRFVEECNQRGYDIGFIRFVAEKVFEKLKINHILALTNEKYFQMVHNAENSKKTKYEKIICNWWLNNKTVDMYESDKECAEKLNIQRERFNEAKLEILKRFDIDITIPRVTYEAILYNRENAALSIDERRDHVLNQRGESSNSYVRIERRREVDKNRLEIVANLIREDDINNAAYIRKFSPVKVTPSKFWIYKQKESS